MKLARLFIFLTVLSSAAVFAQQKPATLPVPKTIELFSPWIIKGGKTTGIDYKLHGKSCLDLVREAYGCNVPQMIGYGDMVGVNVNLFHVTSLGQRTRMIRIGKYSWMDKFQLPSVSPWPELAPGEVRRVTINASGADGFDGKNGADGGFGSVNGDGTLTLPAPGRLSNSFSYATAGIDSQSTSVVEKNGKKIRSDGYRMNCEVKEGHMYAVRVVDKTNDFYMLIHVDKVVSAKSVLLSYIRLEVPKSVF